MSESLKELVARRLAEIGSRRGGDPISLLQAWEALPEDENGKRPISYETARRVSTGDHTNIGGKAADALAQMLGVHSDDVLLAAGKRIRLGRFTLPDRADRLDRKERRVVLAVVEAILDAAESKEGQAHGQTPAEKNEQVEPIDLKEAQKRRKETDGKGLLKEAARKRDKPRNPDA